MPASLGGRSCTDPASLYQYCQQNGIATDRWAGRAGLYATGPGPKPGRGTFLIKLVDLNAITLTADTPLVIVGADAAHTVTIPSVTVLNRECVTPGGPNDPNAVFMVDVADRRHLLGRIPLDKAYNLRKATGTGYYSATLNSGTAWTWQQIVTNITTALGIGTLTLPFTPDATPENLVYWGHPSALECLCDVLDRLACALTYDPVANTFAAVQLGTAADTYLDAITDPKVWAGYSASYARAWRPEKVRVRFPRRPVDRTNWNTPFYFVDVTLAATTGVQSGTYVQLDDDLSALAATGTPSNSAALTTRATERAEDWLTKRDFYERRYLVAWRDFVPSASALGGYAVRRVVFDDRGTFQTWAEGGYDGLLEAWRPLGGWPVWWPWLAPDSSTANTPSGADSCGWTAGADTSTCMRMTIVSATGKCSAIDTAQSIELAWDTSAYKSGASDFTGTGSGGTGQVVLDLSGATPAATIDNVSGKFMGCSGDGGLLFAFGGSILCGGTSGTCNNYFVARFDCECCSIANWDGAGWYCVRDAGSSDPYTATLLTDADRCDTLIELQAGGPYADQASAEVACPPVTPVTTACCTVNSVLYLHTSAGQTFLLTWNGLTGGSAAWSSGIVSVTGCGTSSFSFSCGGTGATGFDLGGAGVGADCSWVMNALSKAGSCSPFSFSIDGTQSPSSPSCPCTTTLTFTVNESP